MKLNDKRVASIFTKSKIPARPINVDNGDIIYPFVVKAGFISSTEEGYVYNNVVEDYGRFERIWTGYEQALIQWEESTYAVANKVNGVVDGVKKQFRRGRSFIAKRSGDTQENTIEKYGFDDAFLVDRDVITLTYDTNQVFREEDIFKMYLIPSRYGKTIFRITNVEQHPRNNNKDIAYSTITIESLNADLSETGIAVNQFIQFAAAGEGYAFPKEIERIRYGWEPTITHSMDNLPLSPKAGDEVVVDDYFGDRISKLKYNSIDKEWYPIANYHGNTLDTPKLYNRPVKSLQVEIFGKGVLSDVYMYGRPIADNGTSQGEKIDNSRLLLVGNALTPITGQQEPTRPLARNTKYYVIGNGQIDVSSWWDDWKEKSIASANPSKKKEYEGFLKVLWQEDQTHHASVWEKILNVATYIFAAPVAGALAYTKTWNPWNETTKLANLTDALTTDDTGALDAGKMFAWNFFKNKAVQRLPMDYTETVNWSLKDIPIIGGLLDKLTLGFPVAWATSTNLGGDNFGITGLIPSTLLDFYVNGVYGTKKVGKELYAQIPLDAFDDEVGEEFMSAGEFATSVRFDLTDTYKITKPKDYNGDIIIGEGEIRDTRDIGLQLPNETDDEFEARKLNLQGMIPTPHLGFNSWALDIVGLHFLGKADVKITCFDDTDTPVYTAMFKTNSKLTGSIRDWNTTIKLSNWEYNDILKVDNRILPTPSMDIPYQETTTDTTAVVPVWETDTNGDIKVDVNGNFIPQRDIYGQIIYEEVLLNQATPSSTSTTPQFKLPNFPPIQHIVLSDTIVSNSSNNYKTTDINLKDLLSQKGYTIKNIGQYKYLELDISGTSHWNADGWIDFLSFGITGAAGLVANAINDAVRSPQTFKFEITPNSSNPLNITDYTLNLVQGTILDYDYFKVLANGDIFLSGYGGKTQLTSTMKLTNISIHN